MKKLFLLFITLLATQVTFAQTHRVVLKDGRTKYLSPITIDEEKIEYVKGMAIVRIKMLDVEKIYELEKPKCDITVKATTTMTSSSLETDLIYDNFIVTKAKDPSLIGKKVKMQAVRVRKSNISGSEGQIVLRPLYIIDGENDIQLLPTDIFRRGLNRSNVKFWTSFTIIMIFVPGSGATISEGEEFGLNIK